MVWLPVRAEETGILNKHHFMWGYLVKKENCQPLLGKKCWNTDKKGQKLGINPIRKAKHISYQISFLRSLFMKQAKNGYLQRHWKDKGNMEGRRKRLIRGGQKGQCEAGDRKEKSHSVSGVLTSSPLSRSQGKWIGTGFKRKTDLHQLFQNTVTEPDRICKSKVSKA